METLPPSPRPLRIPASAEAAGRAGASLRQALAPLLLLFLWLALKVPGDARAA